jgi:hypothetical protein
LSAALFLLLRLAWIGKRRGRAGRNVTEVFLRQRDAFVRFHIAEHEKYGIVRYVVGLEEGLHVGEIGSVEIGEIAVEIVSVGPVAEGDGGQIEPRKSAVRLVHHVDADFFLHDVALVAQVFIVNLEGAHAVGLEPQHAFERIGRYGLVVVCYIVVRRAIEHAAAGIDQLDVLHLRSVPGALKHHVLKQMREAAAALRLQAKTNFVVDADGDHRRGGVRHDDHLQSVRQRRVFHCDLRSIHPLPPM